MNLIYRFDELFDVLTYLEKSITVREAHHSFMRVAERSHHEIILKEVVIEHAHTTKPSKASHDLIHLLERIMTTKNIKLLTMTI